MRLVKDDENACPDPNGMQRGAWLLRRRYYPFCLPIFRIAISRGALCQGSEVYFWFRLLRLGEIRLRRGLDKNFHSECPMIAAEELLTAKGAKKDHKGRGLNVRARTSLRTRVARSVEIVLRQTAWLPLSSANGHRAARLQPHRESV